MTIIRKPIKDRFTIVDNSAIEDKRLSLKTLGLYLKMVSLPDDWVFSENGLQSAFKCGRAELRSALQQLEECGYLTRYKTRDKSTGRFININWVLVEVSTKSTTSDFPTVDNHTVSNTNISNTNIIYTNNDCIESFRKAYKDIFNIEHRTIKGNYIKISTYEPQELYKLAYSYMINASIDNCNIDYFESIIDRFK